MSAKDLLACSQARGQVHTTNTRTYPGPPLSVLNMRGASCNLVNHTPPSVGHHVIGCAPLNKKLAQPFVSTPSPSEARKIGDHTPHKIPQIYKTVGFVRKTGCCALNR